LLAAAAKIAKFLSSVIVGSMEKGFGVRQVSLEALENLVHAAHRAGELVVFAACFLRALVCVPGQLDERDGVAN
jgi:hypothetical protein